MNKKFLIFISFFIFFLSIANVVASEDLNETLDMTDEVKLVSDAETFTTLQNTNPATPGSNVDLKENGNNLSCDEKGNGNIAGFHNQSRVILNSDSVNLNITVNNEFGIGMNNEYLIDDKFSLNNESKYNIEVLDVTKFFNGSERFIVRLSDNKNNPISNASVKMSINGQTYTRSTDNHGQASIPLNLVSGVYDVVTEYCDDKYYSTVTINPTIVSDDFTKIFRNDTQYCAKFTDSQGNLLKNTPVQLNINGVIYTRTTDDEGIAKLNINLYPGTYILTAQNPFNGEMQAVNITVLSSIVENYDLTKYYKNDSQYTIRLLDIHGNPVGIGESVIFNINGVFYNRTSNESGYVKMNINLNPGDYIITANYNGLMLSNKITVLNILDGKDLIMCYHDGSKYETKLLDGQGNPYPGQNITFNINGVFYNRTTDSEGIARLNINLQSGTYIITATYNGLGFAHIIRIDSSTNSYDCGNGHKLEIAKSATVTSDDSNSYNIKYKDGGAYFTYYDYGDNFDMSDYLVRAYDFNNYIDLESYGDWTAIGLVMFDPLKYELLYYDKYLYTITVDDLNIAKRVADSFI